MAKRRKQHNGAKPQQKTKLEKVGLVDTGRTLGEIRKAMKLGQRYAEKGEWADAVKHLLIAWDAMPEDLSILTVLSHALVQLGVREHAIAVLQRALEVHEPTPELIGIILRLALEMGMHDIAVKLGEQLVVMEPTNPTNIVNLATAYSGVKRFSESIAMLQQALPQFPDNADLWNVLATQVRERDGVDSADVFFEEALKLRPGDAKILSNFSISFTRRNEVDRALELALKSIEADPSQPEPRVGAAQFQFLKGQMEEGWENYEYRHHIRRKSNQTQHYTHKLPLWDGEDLSGKALLVAAEQGIGDEVMWGSYLPYLYDQADKLFIGCDPRLISIYQRRFPDAIVCGYLDRVISGYRYRVFPAIEKMMKEGEAHIDFYTPVASAPKHAWQSMEAVKPYPEGYLSPEEGKKQEFALRLGAISDKPKVGLAWRSGVVATERAYLYSGIDNLGPLLALKDKVDFVNLQYGDVADELDEIERKHGARVHNFEDVNLKADIEANLAIAAGCDAVVSVCSAPGIFSMSVGTATLLMSGAPPWWSFGSPNKIPFAQHAELFSCKGMPDWADIMNRVAARVEELTQG
ncbi:MAG: hypothetical protein JJ850_17805 [Kordiimonadaceae bacterium]|nr:hypothetical protein [Kordiimonadaceae bacterium]MBO6570660.1 hypothetical protein [Kordiimonadaceae bacterium]MBO6966482.1 hypothetical protein [Kordiimonadaceae bacterium]